MSIALKFLHEAGWNIFCQFDRNKIAGRISLKLSFNAEISPSHGNEFTVHHVVIS